MNIEHPSFAISAIDTSPGEALNAVWPPYQMVVLQRRPRAQTRAGEWTTNPEE
jgi:hypothetical protein